MEEHFFGMRRKIASFAVVFMEASCSMFLFEVKPNCDSCLSFCLSDKRFLFKFVDLLNSRALKYHFAHNRINCKIPHLFFRISLIFQFLISRLHQFLPRKIVLLKFSLHIINSTRYLENISQHIRHLIIKLKIVFFSYLFHQKILRISHNFLFLIFFYFLNNFVQQTNLFYRRIFTTIFSTLIFNSKKEEMLMEINLFIFIFTFSILFENLKKGETFGLRASNMHKNYLKCIMHINI